MRWFTRNVMDNIFEELTRTEEALKNLYEKSSEIRAGMAIKYLKHQLNEYINDFHFVS